MTPRPRSGQARPFATAALLLLCACPAEEKPDPKALAEGHYLAGSAAYLKGDFAEAHTHFDEVKKLNPADPRLPAAIGEVYLAELKIPEAEAQYLEAVKLDPKRATNWSRLGYVRSLRGDKAGALEALGKALALNPDDFNALEAIGELKLKQGNFAGAIDDFTRAARHAPDHARALLYLRASGELNRRGKRDEAIALLVEARGAGVKAPELLSELGDLLVAKGELPRAVEIYTEAAKASTGKNADPTLWELVGELQLKLGRPAEAEGAFHESIRVKNRALPHVALARICLARKEPVCANDELELALRAATGEEERETIDLSDLLSSMGRKKDALALLGTLASEPDRRTDVELQLKVARLAKELGDKPAIAAACANVAAADGGVKKCP